MHLHLLHIDSSVEALLELEYDNCGSEETMSSVMLTFSASISSERWGLDALLRSLHGAHLYGLRPHDRVFLRIPFISNLVSQLSGK